MVTRATNSVSPDAVAEKVQQTIGHVHLVNSFNGVVGQKLKCFRCQRKLPENMFAFLGPRFLGRGKYGVRKTVTALHPHCQTCRKQAKGKWVDHPLYTPELDRFWTRKISGIRSSAMERSIFFGLDHDDLLGRYLEQDGKCAISGLPMQPFRLSDQVKSARNMASPSVDRIDNDKFYTLDNIQIVLGVVNTMKGELPQDAFLELCQQIATQKMFS